MPHPRPPAAWPALREAILALDDAERRYLMTWLRIWFTEAGKLNGRGAYEQHAHNADPQRWRR